MSFWNEARIEELRKLWTIDKLSADQIAKRMGAKSRYVITGKLYKLGLTSADKGKKYTRQTHLHTTALVQRPKAQKSITFLQDLSTLNKHRLSIQNRLENKRLQASDTLEDKAVIKPICAYPIPVRGDDYCLADACDGSLYCANHARSMTVSKDEDDDRAA